MIGKRKRLLFTEKLVRRTSNDQPALAAIDLLTHGKRGSEGRCRQRVSSPLAYVPSYSRESRIGSTSERCLAESQLSLSAVSGAYFSRASKGKTRFQSRFMSTTVHWFAVAASKALSRRPKGELRS